MKIIKVEKIELTPEEDIQICQFLRTLNIILNTTGDPSLLVDTANLLQNLHDFREKYVIKGEEKNAG